MKVKSESEVTESCPTLSDPMDCSLPGSSVHGIFQARVLEWGAIAFSDNTLYLDTNMIDFFKMDWLTKPFNQLYVQALAMYTYVQLFLQIIKTVKLLF